MSALTKLKQIFDTDSAPAGLKEWETFIQDNPAPEWLMALRTRAHDKFASRGLPTPKFERYKYSNVATFLKNVNLSFAASDVKLSGDTKFTRQIMDVLNDTPDWVREMAMAIPAGEAQYNDMMLWDAVNAYLRDGITLDVPSNYAGNEALHVEVTGHKNTYFVPRTFLRIGENAQFTMVENHTGNGEYWNNRVTQIHVQRGARFRHYRIQDNAAESAYTQNTHVILEQDATYEAFVLTTGSAFSRNQIHAELRGAGGEVRLAGANLLKGSQVADTTITIEHQAPHCKSNQTYKSILDDTSRGVFQGKVHVHRPAQKTDGYQLANALLLSPTAEMDTKPELEIYADDVKCSHGATTGQMDTGPLFYLRSRGLSEAQAKLLLMQAFIGPALDEIRDDDVREMFSGLTLDWLGKQTVK